MVNRAAGVRIALVDRLGRSGLFVGALSRGRRRRGLRLEVAEKSAEVEEGARRQARPGCMGV